MKKFLLFLFAATFLSTQVFSQSTLTVSLGWDLNTDGTTTGYNLYYKEFGASTYTKTNAGNTNVISIKVFPNVLYSYMVTAYNKDGQESEFSAEVRSQDFYVNANGSPTSLIFKDFVSTNFTSFSVLQPAKNGSLSGTLPNVYYLANYPVVPDMIVYKSPQIVNGTNVINYYGFNPVTLKPPVRFIRK